MRNHLPPGQMIEYNLIEIREIIFPLPWAWWTCTSCSGPSCPCWRAGNCYRSRYSGYLFYCEFRYRSPCRVHPAFIPSCSSWSLFFIALIWKVPASVFNSTRSSSRWLVTGFLLRILFLRGFSSSGFAAVHKSLWIASLFHYLSE